ncbi:helix-turn-helix transcriptional regulator [Streptomyces sp. JJ66]|uniref:helix-turn-helix domain-containing protein n=1 Tax=Streptomyces sp. JJ66 TaxID=2803843 RepID=UPI001C5861E4|nr:helix-turn-helix transcriptional regulator [Streptomyces sp. JJ66]MBW1602466.1 helix-turn-helix transcriptional regulator [Streptomyces sp. JJ66]
MDDDGLLDDEVEDDSGAVMRAVGRQIKLWREDAGLTQTELGTELGYSEEMISAVERGRRLPKATMLARADVVLNAGGKIKAMTTEVEEARYPRKVRNIARLEADSVEMGVYSAHVVHALLQTEEYMRGLFAEQRPLLAADLIERNVSARMARQEILDGSRTVPAMSFVLEEVTLRRPLQGRDAHRRQLTRLLEVGHLRNVEIQVMPTGREEHAGLDGSFRLFKLRGGVTLGYCEVQHLTRIISKPPQVQSLELRYGTIRAQALTPRESLAFIEKVLGET